MKTKLLLLCLFLVSALLASGCTGLASGDIENETVAESPRMLQTPEATTNTPENTAVTPSVPETAEAIPSTPKNTAGTLVLPKPVEHTGLTQEEWERAVQIALTLPELSEWLQKGLPYRTEPRWFYKRPGSTEWLVNKTYIPPDTPNVSETTPGVEISLGSPQQMIFSIAVDLDSGKPVTYLSSAFRLLPASQFSLRYLTEEEFAEVIRIASEATSVSIDPAKVELYWVSVNGGIYTRHDYDAVEKGIRDVLGVSGATFYPTITVKASSGDQMVIVDLKNRKVLGIIPIGPKGPLTKQ